MHFKRFLSMRRRYSFKLLSQAVVCATLMLVALPHSSDAQERSLREGFEVREFSEPFPEWIIRSARSKSKLPIQSQSTQSGLDRFERIGPHGKRPDELTPSPMGYPIGRKKVLVVIADILARNEDGSTRLIPSPMRTAAEVRAFLFGSTNGLNSELFAASWRNLFLDGDITGDEDIDIFGPVTLTYDTLQATDSKGSAPDFAGGDITTIGNLCSRFPVASDYRDLGVIDVPYTPNLTLTLIAPGAKAYFNCPWYAATLTESSAIVSIIQDPSSSESVKDVNRRAIIHEVGHAIGLDHSHGPSIVYEGPDNSWAEAAKEYGDLTCLMGFGPYYGVDHFNVPQSYRLGWLPRSSVIEISKAGSYTVTLDNPSKGPAATLPTSVWIERKATGYTNAPGFVVVSAGTGGSLVERIKVTQATLSSPRIVTEQKEIPFGLTVHSVGLGVDGGYLSGNFFDRADDGGAYLEGVVELGKSFEVPNLGVSVKLLKREGNRSVVQVVVKDMHRIFTEKVEELAPSTGDSLKVIARMRDGDEISAAGRLAVRALSRVFERSASMLCLQRDVSPYSYFAGEDVKKVVMKIQTGARKVLLKKGGRQRELFHKLLKPAALQYLTYAAGKGDTE